MITAPSTDVGRPPMEPRAGGRDRRNVGELTTISKTPSSRPPMWIPTSVPLAIRWIPAQTADGRAIARERGGVQPQRGRTPDQHRGSGRHHTCSMEGGPQRSPATPGGPHITTSCDKGFRLPQERKSGANLGLRLTTPDHETGPLVAAISANTPSHNDDVMRGDRSSACCLLVV